MVLITRAHATASENAGGTCTCPLGSRFPLPFGFARGGSSLHVGTEIVGEILSLHNPVATRTSTGGPVPRGGGATLQDF